MKKIKLILALAVTFFMSSNLAMAGSDLVDRFTDNQLIRLLKDEGYGAVTSLKEGAIRIKINGRSYILFNLDDGDLQLYYGATGVKLTYRIINEWNRTKRLSRAYLDDKKDPVLEADLLSNGGMTNEKVAAFFRVFVQSVKKFRTYILEKDLS